MKLKIIKYKEKMKNKDLVKVKKKDQCLKENKRKITVASQLQTH